jgi:hypothetical protein
LTKPLLQANLLGSSLSLYLAHTLKQKNRRRYEISRLYQPISSSSGFHSRARNRFQDLERNGRASHESYEGDEDDVWGDRQASQTRVETGLAHPETNPTTLEEGFTLGHDEDEDAQT